MTKSVKCAAMIMIRMIVTKMSHLIPLSGMKMADFGLGVIGVIYSP